MSNVIVEALKSGDYSDQVLKDALLLKGGEEQELFAAAREKRLEFYPDNKAQARSVIEISNICRQRCRYCSIGGKDQRFNYSLDANQMEMLMAIGFIMLARLNINHAKRQFIIIACSVVIFLIIPILIKKLAFLKKLTWVYGGIGMAGLLIVLIAGNVVNGSKLNFNVFGLIFQPSEMIKIMFAFFIAGLLYESAELAVR